MDVEHIDPKRRVNTMTENEVIAVVRGLAPRIHELVTDTFAKAVVPPELAEQVASAVRLLHESPPIKPDDEDEQTS